MPEYIAVFTIELRLTGEKIIEADNLEAAQAFAARMLDDNVFDMDFTIYEGELQSEDIFWDQESFDVGLRDVRESTDDL